MSNDFRTSGQQVAEITNVPVATARANTARVYKLAEKELADLPIEQSNTVFGMLQASQQMRNQVMQGAMQDHQAAAEYQRKMDAEAVQAKLEQEQAEIAKANVPRLVQVGQGGHQ